MWKSKNKFYKKPQFIIMNESIKSNLALIASILTIAVMSIGGYKLYVGYQNQINSLESEIVILKKRTIDITSSIYSIKEKTKGDIGPQGPIGPNGNQGATGPIGLRGPKGDQGIQGPEGPEGPSGKRGIKGPKGNNGESGLEAYIITKNKILQNDIEGNWVQLTDNGKIQYHMYFTEDKRINTSWSSYSGWPKIIDQKYEIQGVNIIKLIDSDMIFTITMSNKKDKLRLHHKNLWIDFIKHNIE